jgi:hypothetical protein
MAREFRCAVCGGLVKHADKAIPRVGRIVTLIYPHACSDEIDMDLTISPIQSEIDHVIEQERLLRARAEKDEKSGFPYLEKLNKITSEVEASDPFQLKAKKRKQDKDISSTAPFGLREMALGQSTDYGPTDKEFDEDSEMEG